MNAKKITPADREAVLAARAAGRPLHTIIEDSGLSDTSIRRILKAALVAGDMRGAVRGVSEEGRARQHENGMKRVRDSIARRALRGRSTIAVRFGGCGVDEAFDE